VTAVLLGAISLSGCVGLWACPPRPCAQETWAIVIAAPIFILMMLLITGADLG
jgi:hypothetical protein